MRETPKAAAAFLVYWELGPTRTLEKVVDFYRKQAEDKQNQDQEAKTEPKKKKDKPFTPSLSQMKEWSRQHGWQARIVQRENQLSLERELKKNADRESMDVRQADIATLEQRVAIEHIAFLRKEGKLGATATVQLLKIALDAERVARGAPTEIRSSELSGPGGGPIPVEQTNPDLDLLTDEEFEELENLQKILRKRKEQRAIADQD